MPFIKENTSFRQPETDQKINFRFLQIVVPKDFYFVCGVGEKIKIYLEVFS